MMFWKILLDISIFSYYLQYYQKKSKIAMYDLWRGSKVAMLHQTTDLKFLGSNSDVDIDNCAKEI